MNIAPPTLLLIESDPDDAGSIQLALTDTKEILFRVEWVACLADALERLREGAIDLVLADLKLPDGQGLDAIDQLLEAAPNTLILFLSDSTDEETARQAEERGAHGILAKADIDAHWAPRMVRYVFERKAAGEALQESEERFRAISELSPLGIFVSDAEGSCVYTNAAYHQISGLTFDQTLGTHWSMAIHPVDRQRVLAEWLAAVQGKAPFHSEARFLHKDGSFVWARMNSAAMRRGSTSSGFVQTVEDISPRKLAEAVLQAAEDALFEEQERARVTLNSIGDAVLASDLDGNVTYLNVVAEAMTGWSRDEALGRPLSEVFRIIDANTRRIAVNPARRAIQEDRTVGLAANCVLIRRDGVESAIEDSSAPIHNRDGEITGAVMVFRDVSQSRAITQRMSHLAQHDALTGLPNRVLLTERSSLAIGLAQRHRKQVALLFIDLDHFKRINDSLGHGIGDKLLKSAAERLVACVRTTDTVCRLGGDEFVVLLAEIERPQDADHVAEKLLSAFALPHLINGQQLYVSLSIGIGTYPDDGASIDALMQKADTAMYQAKASGRNHYHSSQTPSALS
jgi:diguanylate cyclase (GGDEF)-like protein/PAS domain S-box-containing protein